MAINLTYGNSDGGVGSEAYRQGRKVSCTIWRPVAFRFMAYLTSTNDKGIL